MTRTSRWLTRTVPDSIPDDMLQRVVPDERLSLRAAADDDGPGTFEGYAVLWDTVDAYGTTFARGSVSAGGLDSGLYALLDMHNPEKPLGTFTAREDDRGLWIAGSWDDTRDGRDARARAKSGSAPGLSIGFRPLATDPDDPDRFTQVRLVEVSQITARMAAVPGAAFAGVRKQDDDGQRVELDDTQRTQLARARAALLLTYPHR